MSGTTQRVAILLAVLAAAAPVRADDRDDFLRLLKARDDSLGNYDVRARQVHFEFKLEDYNDLRASIERASASPTEGLTPSQWVQKLVDQWAKEPGWIDRHMIQSGDRFKETLTRPGNEFVDVDLYDGLLYYSHPKYNRQLDIHSRIPNIGHADLQFLGITMKPPRERDQITALEKSKDGFRAVFTVGKDNDPFTVVDFHPDLDRRHSRSVFSGGKVIDESWYLFRERMDGSFVPRVRVNVMVSHLRYSASVRVYLIESLHLNCPIAEEDLTLGDVPAQTLVVDHRFGLSQQWHYSEYCQSSVSADALRGGAKAEDLIEYLDRSQGPRAAVSIRDSRVGRMAPALEVTNWLQKPPALAKWPADRPVLLEFWSISCGPCIGRIPENNKLAEWVESQGGVFVSVHSATHEIPEIRAFLENHELRYAVGLDKAGGPRPYSGSATFAAYGIDATPTCVTIGRSGRILSYRHLSTQALEKLLAQEPAEAPRGRSSAEVRPLTVLPGAWRVSGLEPGAEAQGRVFLFRPDTPDLTLRAARDTNSPVRPTWTRHSAGSQTVYEIQLRAKAPDYGRTLKGQIALIAEYNKQEHLVDIPYQIAGRGLVHCDTPALWFGCLHPGDTITKDITLRATAQPPVHVDVGSVPAGLRVRRQEQEVSSTGPRITVSFSSPQPGLHEGVLNLLVSDDNGNRQSVPLGYCAFVQP